MEQISRIGMDTSKHFFQFHGVNTAEKVVLRKKLRRKEMVAFFKALAPIALEMHQRHARPLEPDLFARCRSEVLKDHQRADVSLSGNLYKLWNRPGDVLPIVPKEI